jgi:two-component sensor histidine kinase
VNLAKRLTISSLFSLLLAFALAFVFWNTLTGRLLESISQTALTELTNVYFETSSVLADNFFSRYDLDPEQSIDGQLGANAFRICPQQVWTTLLECTNLPGSLSYLSSVITREMVEQWWITHQINGKREFSFETVTAFLNNPGSLDLPVIGYVKLYPNPANPNQGVTVIYAQAMHTLLARSVSLRNQIIRAMGISTFVNLIISLGALGVTFVVLKLRLQKLIHQPVSLILTGLNAIQQGRYQKPIAPLTIEEFNLIATEINTLATGTRTLIHEVHHRVKNNMQIVGALLEMQRMETDFQDAALTLELSYARIYAMAMIHEHLYTTRDFETVEPYKYCQSLFGFYQQNNPEYKLNIDLSQVTKTPVDAGTLTNLGLILNELIINSLKHGFTLTGTNHIALNLELSDQEGTFLYVNWTVPPIPSFKPSHSGFGTELIWNLTAQIDTSPEFSYGDRFTCGFTWKTSHKTHIVI